MNSIKNSPDPPGRFIPDFENRMNKLLDVLLKFTRLDFSTQAEVSSRGDEIDAVALGLNTLSEELRELRLKEQIQQEYVKENEERLRLLVGGVKDYAIINLTPEGLIESWNQGAEKIEGYTEQEIIGKHFSVFYTPEEIAGGEPGNNLRAALAQGSHEGQGWRKRKDGTLFMADVVITTLYDELGRIKGYAKITRDITQQKEAEIKILELNNRLWEKIQEMELINSELEAFTYSVSHDLRAPVRAIHSYSRILYQEQAQNWDTESRGMIQSVERNAQHMGQLIDDLLAFTRLGRKEITRTLGLDMTELAREAWRSVADTARAYPIRLDLKILETASADPTLIRQVFVNLLSNAFKYSSNNPNAVITLTSVKEPKECIYCIQDNGVGFDMRYYNKLFRVFQRLHTTDQFEGTGVGLALVKRIITKHGGRVWASSEPGQGASFYFSLPY
ncbi:MAG TPA: ATP-binding protein [Bacteroidia bacterium]|jgi:PAS domain S-box-containing protein|nr:ATP-binding protein [Bacteroidia bacterium]